MKQEWISLAGNIKYKKKRNNEKIKFRESLYRISKRTELKHWFWYLLLLLLLLHNTGQMGFSGA